MKKEVAEFFAIAELENGIKAVEEGEKVAEAAEEAGKAEAMIQTLEKGEEGEKAAIELTKESQVAEKNALESLKAGNVSEASEQLEIVAKNAKGTKARKIRKSVATFLKKNPKTALGGLSATGFEGYCIIKGNADPVSCAGDVAEHVASSAGKATGKGIKELLNALGIPTWGIAAFVVCLFIVMYISIVSNVSRI